MASSSHGGATRGRLTSHAGMSPYDSAGASLFFKHAGQSTNRPQTVYDRRSHPLSHAATTPASSTYSTQRNREMALQRLHQTISSGHHDPSIARYTYGYRPGSISVAFRATTAADSLRPDVAGIRGRATRPLTAEHYAAVGRPLTAENFSSAGRPLTATNSYADPGSRYHSYDMMDTEEDAVTLIGGEPPTPPKDKLWTIASSILQHQRHPPSHAAVLNAAAGLTSQGGPLQQASETRPRSAAIGGSNNGNIVLNKSSYPLFRHQQQEGSIMPPNAQITQLVPPAHNLTGSALYAAMRLPRIDMQGMFDPFSSFEGSRAAWLADSDLACRVGVSSVKGRRLYMEDEYKIIHHLEALCPNENHLQPHIKTSFWGVFDGHAGGRCSKALAQTLAPTLVKELDFHSDMRGAVLRGFQRTNTDFLKKADKYQMNDGSTATTAFYRDGKLCVANVGDSRVVLCSKGKAVAMSQDHKPSKPDERRRIMALGGKVVNCFGVARVNGVLAVARAFGNRTMRSVIRADADVTERYLTDGDDFLILASDGLWDTLTNQEAVDIVTRCADKIGLQACAELLTATSIRKGSMDNTTAVIVDLRPYRLVSSSNSMVAVSKGGPTSSSYHGAPPPSSSTSATTTTTTTPAESSTTPAFSHTRRHSTGELNPSPTSTRDITLLRMTTAPHGAGIASSPSLAPTTDKTLLRNNKL